MLLISDHRQSLDTKTEFLAIFCCFYSQWRPIGASSPTPGEYHNTQVRCPSPCVLRGRGSTFSSAKGLTFARLNQAVARSKFKDKSYTSVIVKRAITRFSLQGMY